jgi:hypothetical protein
VDVLRRWWRSLWPAPADPGPPPRPAVGNTDTDPAATPRTPARRRYTVPPADDPQREAHLGAVLQALGGGVLTRDELDRRVGAAEWGPGRLDAVVAYGISTGVLLDGDGDGDGDAVRARYAD